MRNQPASTDFLARMHGFVEKQDASGKRRISFEEMEGSTGPRGTGANDDDVTSKHSAPSLPQGYFWLKAFGDSRSKPYQRYRFLKEGG